MSKFYKGNYCVTSAKHFPQVMVFFGLKLNISQYCLLRYNCEEISERQNKVPWPHHSSRWQLLVLKMGTHRSYFIPMVLLVANNTHMNRKWRQKNDLGHLCVCVCFWHFIQLLATNQISQSKLTSPSSVAQYYFLYSAIIGSSTSSHILQNQVPQQPCLGAATPFIQGWRRTTNFHHDECFKG